MRIVGRDKLKKAEEQYPGSGLGNALSRWVKIVEGVNWNHFPDVKATFGKRADNVDPYVVFDIKGNDFRLISIVNYQIKIVAVKEVKTHQQYTREGVQK